VILLGAGAGLWTGTLISALPVKRRAWYIALSLGLAFGAGGLGWNIGTLGVRRDQFNDNGMCPTCGSLTPDEWKTTKISLLPSSFLIGLGTGIFLASTTNLIAARQQNRKFSIRPASTGLQINF
jgi:hypothetical protein